MTDQNNCPGCGARLPEESTEGLCHKCLLEVAIRDDTLDHFLRIRCPHCDNPVEILGDSHAADVTCPSCNSRFGLIRNDEPPAESPKQVGRFEIKESIGTGSFGTVYKARDPELDRWVAIKIPRQRQDAGLFLKEAKSAARLNHPNIVSVHEIGQDEDRFFIVADLVEGDDLATWLAGHRPTIDDTVRFCQRIARALEHAHAAGVIHRDLKPANILLATTNAEANGQTSLGSFEPMVTDFGLAKRDAGEITMTAPGKILGTPAYMSPEQATGDGFQADARSDVYSLGVILFELLTGEKPFRGNLQMLLKQVQEEDPPRPRKLNNRIPADLETITLKCLDKRPAARYQSAKELDDELERYIERKPIRARPISSLERGWRWCRRNPVVAGLTSLAAILLLCVAGVSTVGYLNQVAQTNALKKSQYGDEMKGIYAGMERFVEGKFVKQTLRKWHPDITGQDLRGWEWYLLNSFFHRDVATLRGHKGTAEDVDWSSDGQLLASVGGDGEIIVWDGTNHETLRTVENAHDGRIWCISWHPTERKFATGGEDGLVKLWDENGNKLAEFSHEKTIRHLVWRPSDGKLIAGDDNFDIVFWNVEERVKVRSIKAREPHAGPFGVKGVLGLDWSEKHGLVSAADNSDLRTWNENETDFEQPAHTEDDEHFVAWQPGGDILAFGGKSRSVVLWNKATKTIESSFDCRHFVFDGTWHPTEPLLAVCGHDSTVRIWDHEAKRERAFIGHASPVLGVSWRPGTKQLASAGHDGTVRIWSMDTPRNVQEYPAETFCWNPDGSQLGCIVGLEVHIIDMATNEVRVFEDRLLEKNGQRNIAWSPDGKLIATSYYPKPESDRKSMLLIWDVATGKQLRTISNPAAGWTSALSWHPDGTKLLYHGRKTRILDATTGEILREVEGKDGLMSIFSPDGTRVISMTGNTTGPEGSHISVWDSNTGNEQFALDKYPAFTAIWDPTGKFIASACTDGAARIWDSTTGTLVRTLRGHAGWVTVVAWSPDGQRLASAGDLGLIKIWNPNTEQEIVTLDSTVRDIMAGLQWSPDGKKLVTRGYFSQATIRIWDASKGYEEADTPLSYDPEKEKAVVRMF